MNACRRSPARETQPRLNAPEVMATCGASAAHRNGAGSSRIPSGSSPHLPEEERAMRAAIQSFAHQLPDQETVAGFDAVLAGLDPDTARQVLHEGLAEIGLWQHHLRVQESRYASDDGQPRELFRIG
jgi:hypothetical protein